MRYLFLVSILALCFACTPKAAISSGDAPCVDTINPFEVDWMDRLIDLHNPNQVLKYPKGSEWDYLFRSIPNSYLYDCRGNLICESKSNQDNCFQEHLSLRGQGLIIWQGEGVWD